MLVWNGRYTKGTSNKYYEVHVHTAGRRWEVYTQWGRIGHTGGSQVHSFRSKADADDFAAERVREKRKKGYRTSSKRLTMGRGLRGLGMSEPPALATPPWRVDLVQITNPHSGAAGWFCVETTRRGVRAYDSISPCEGQVTATNLFCADLPQQRGAPAVVGPKDYGSKLWRTAACEAILAPPMDFGVKRPSFGPDHPKGLQGVSRGRTGRRKSIATRTVKGRTYGWQKRKGGTVRCTSWTKGRKQATLRLEKNKGLCRGLLLPK